MSEPTGMERAEIPPEFAKLAESLAEATADMMATPESIARTYVSMRYDVPNDDEHIRIDRAEEVDGVLHITASVKRDAPLGFLNLTVTGPS